MTAFDSHGPNLQVAMFASGDRLDPRAVEAVADRARVLFAA
jgi:hypothetical protein